MSTNIHVPKRQFCKKINLNASIKFIKNKYKKDTILVFYAYLALFFLKSHELLINYPHLECLKLCFHLKNFDKKEGL